MRSRLLFRRLSFLSDGREEDVVTVVGVDGAVAGDDDDDEVGGRGGMEQMVGPMGEGGGVGGTRGEDDVRSIGPWWQFVEVLVWSTSAIPSRSFASLL